MAWLELRLILCCICWLFCIPQARVLLLVRLKTRVFVYACAARALWILHECGPGNVCVCGVCTCAVVGTGSEPVCLCAVPTSDPVGVFGVYGAVWVGVNVRDAGNACGGACLEWMSVSVSDG